MPPALWEIHPFCDMAPDRQHAWKLFHKSIDGTYRIFQCGLCFRKYEEDSSG
jgi:hypothetical protein